MARRKVKIIKEGCRHWASNYKRTKVKELLSKKGKRTFITLNGKRESYTVNGFLINQNGKVIY